MFQLFDINTGLTCSVPALAPSSRKTNWQIFFSTLALALAPICPWMLSGQDEKQGTAHNRIYGHQSKAAVKERLRDCGSTGHRPLQGGHHDSIWCHSVGA